MLIKLLHFFQQLNMATLLVLCVAVLVLAYAVRPWVLSIKRSIFGIVAPDWRKLHCPDCGRDLSHRCPRG